MTDRLKKQLADSKRRRQNQALGLRADGKPRKAVGALRADGTPRTGPQGRVAGYVHDPRTIEKIRGTINAKLCIDTLTKLVDAGTKEDSVRVQAATVLLRKVIPDLSATDLTSGGESLTVERVAFKPISKRAPVKLK